MPLRARLALAVVLTAAAVATIGGYLFVHELSIGLSRSLDTNLNNRASAAIAEAKDNDPTPLGSGPALPDNESLAQIVTVDGRVLAATRRAGSVPLLSRDQVADSSGGGRGVTTHDGSLRLIARSITVRGSSDYVVIGTPLASTYAAIDRVRAQVVLAGSAIVVFAGAMGWFIAGAALRPVERLRRQVAALETDDLTEVDVPPRRDELAQLARTMNEMLNRVRRSRRRERAFIAEASHELRTPLAILRGELELAARPGRSIDELTTAVAVASEETDRISRLAEDLLLLARTDTGSLPIRLRAVRPLGIASSSAARGNAAGAPNRISVEVTGEEDLMVHADPDRLRQAIDNLVINALHYAPDGSTVLIAAGQTQDLWWLTVTDEGPGFSPEILDRAFEPFAKGPKPPRRTNSEAAGLGLAIVAAIAHAHRGTATAANRPSGGAVVRLDLPFDADQTDHDHRGAARHGERTI